jgi:hypothetical protein
MQVDRELHRQVSQNPNLTRADAPSIPNETPPTRRVSVQLSKRVCEQLEAITERPGVGKSMIVEAALERFLGSTPPIEELMQQYFDQIRARLDHFDRDMQIIAETVALHARYHLTVMPPLPESQQHEACLRGDERFKVLAEQVDRRIRLGRPLMQETIDRLNAVNSEVSVPKNGGDPPSDPEPQRANQEPVESNQAEVRAAAGEGGSASNFRHPPNSICSRL